MTTSDDRLSFPAKLRLKWRLLLRAILHWWVRARILPDPFEDAGIDPDKPTCYVIETYALTSILILDRCCEQLGLPRPLHRMQGNLLGENRAFATLRRMRGIIVRRPTTRRSSEALGQLINAAAENPSVDVQLVPVTVLVGRTPDKETRLAKILFSEDWRIAGRLRRFMSTLINGRNTFVQFSRPISSLEISDENLGPARSVRKISRILRMHFKRVRSAAIGPDLSHRRTVVDRILQSPRVRFAIEEKARREGIPSAKAEKLASGYAREIAANYSYSFIRVASFTLKWFWNRIYKGVELYNFNAFQEVAPSYEVIYVPCHRSHIDYMLLSYLLYQHGFVPPHVAAGVNLNLPVLGSICRLGGAFFLRRSFRSQKLYAAVFNEYVSLIQARGVSIEYFIEGTRSRTGRLLPPKNGMLSMSVRGYLNAPVRPIMFQPIYFGYERLVEGESYTRELYGRKKRAESLTGVFRSLRILKEQYGKAHVNFGKPIFLDELLQQHAPDWRDMEFDTGERPPWLNTVVDDLGRRIMTGINQAADVNSVNLVSSVLLATSKHALAENELNKLIGLWKRLISNSNYSTRVSITKRSEAEIIEYGTELGLLERREHELGDILRLKPESAVQLTYFRNNITHLLALPALVACCFLNQREFPLAHLKRIAMAVRPFLTAELFLPWDRGEFLQVLQEAVDLLVGEGLLTIDHDNEMLLRGEGGSSEAANLRLLARCLLQTLERYYITVSVLGKNGSGTLTRLDLERLCFMTAQRLSMLYEFEAPEFSDRSLFRQFIAQLRKTGVLKVNAEGMLEFDEALERLIEEARYMLSKEVRHGIVHLAPQVPGNGPEPVPE